MHPSTDIEGLVSLTLEEVFRGKDVSVTVQRRVRIPRKRGAWLFTVPQVKAHNTTDAFPTNKRALYCIQRRGHVKG